MLSNDKVMSPRFPCSVIDGTAAAVMKSEPIPEDPTEDGGVYKVRVCM